MECPHIPTVPYHEFSKRIHDKVVADRIPINGSIELTLRCNLRCVHCYAAYNDSKKELTYSEICHILDDITDAGCLWLLITGGEPLLRKDFLDIYIYAKKKGLIITLFTNGTLLTPEIGDFLKEWPPFFTEITLYGMTKRTYENVTRIPGSFERCLKGINLLLERKIPLKLKTMVMALNNDELWQMREYAESLGVEFRFDLGINPRLDGSKEPCQFRLSPEEVVKLDLADRKRREKWREYYQRPHQKNRPDRLYFCGAGQDMFHIDPYAGLSICIMSRRMSYDIRQGSFREGWGNFLPAVSGQEIKGDSKCTRCKVWFLCDHCPGWAELEKGDPESPVEYLCQIAQRRKEALVKEVRARNVQEKVLQKA